MWSRDHIPEVSCEWAAIIWASRNWASDSSLLWTSASEDDGSDLAFLVQGLVSLYIMDLLDILGGWTLLLGPGSWVFDLG